MKIFLSAIILAIAFIGNAQDMVYTDDNQPTLAKVDHLKEYSVSYIKYENEIPSNEISKQKLDSITYANDNKDSFVEVSATNHKADRAYKNLDEGNKNSFQTNSISAGYKYITNLDYSDLNNTNIQAVYVNYQKFLWNNRVGFNAIPFIGLNKEFYGVAANGLFYVKKQGVYRVGLGLEWMYARGMTSYSKYNEPGAYYEEVSGMTKLQSFCFNIYQSINIDERFFISGELVSGAINSNSFVDKQYQQQNTFDYYRDADGIFTIRIGLGYRF